MLPGTNPALDAIFAFVQGDTWSGLPETTIQVDGEAPEYPLIAVRIDFRLQPASPNPEQTLTSDSGAIAITDSANWKIEIAPRMMTLKAGQYFWSIRTQDEASQVLTVAEGKNVVSTPITGGFA